MDDENKNLLDVEIKRVSDELQTMYPGQNGYSDATERLDKLYRLKIEDKKAECEILAREKENENKKEQMAENKIDRWLKVAVDILGILVPCLGYWVWMGRGLRFEETGSYTSKTDQTVSKHFGLKR